MKTHKQHNRSVPALPFWIFHKGNAGVRLELVGAFNRGGNWNNGSNAGVFTLNLNNAPTNTNSNIGFRCARYVSARIARLLEQYHHGGMSKPRIHTDALHLTPSRGVGKISDRYPRFVLVRTRGILKAG